MKSASRRSFLQLQILHRLEQGPARTVTELAEAVGAQRPSVSRSLKTLRGDKLVTRRRNGWTATSTGKEEAKRWNQDISRALRRIEAASTKNSLVDSANRTNSLVNSANGMNSLVNSANRMISLVNSANGMNSLVNSANRMNSLVNSANGMNSLVNSVNRMSSIGSAHRRIEGALPDISDLGIKDPLAEMAERPFLLTPDLEQNDRMALSAIPGGEESPRESLERLLADLNLDLVDKWKGSWQALSDSNPDRLSQAAFSYRELIRMVLDEVAPGVEVDPSKQGSKRKTQVRQVLDGREGDFAGAMVEGLPRLYDLLSKCAHTSYRDKGVVHGALMAGDGLLQMLLSSRRPALS